MRGFLLAAFIAAFGVWASAASPPKEPLPKPSGPQQIADQEQRGTEHAPVVVKIQSAPPIGEEERREKAAERHEKAESDWWLVKLTAALVGVTLLLVGATVFLWLATKRLVKEAKDTASRQLRAYIALDNPIFNGVAVGVAVKNYGATPAHEMTIWVEHTSPAPSSAFACKYGGEPCVAPQMLHPHQAFTSPFVALIEPCLYFPCTAFGRIVYRDIYHHWWVTRFCYVYSTGFERFTPHGPHNREDGPYATMEAACAAPG